MRALKNPGTALLVILAGAFFLRLGTVGFFHRDGYTGDEREFIFLSHQLAEGKGFVDSNGDRSARTPLFPVLLAAIVSVAGRDLTLAHVVNVVLGTAVVWLGYHLVLFFLGDRKAAMIGATAMAVYPGLVIYSGVLQTESLYLVLFLPILMLGQKVMENPSPGPAIAMGVLGGFAALTRAVFLGFFPLILLAIAILMGKERSRALRPLVLALLAYALVLAPWSLRNVLVHDAFVPLSTWGGNSLLIGNNPYATGTWSVKPGFEAWFTERVSAQGHDAAALTEVDRSRISTTLALEYLLGAPLDVARLAVKKAHIAGIYPITNSDSDTALQAVAAGAEFLLLAGAIIGGVATWTFRRRLGTVYLAFAFFTFLQIALHAEARYRLPLTPLLCLFFGAGVSAMSDTRTRTELFSSRGRVRLLVMLLGGVVLAYAVTGVLFLTGHIR